MPPKISQIVNTRRDPGDAFMIKRAPLPAIGNRIGVGANFVGIEPLQVLTFTEEHAHMRTEELVSRAHQEIAVERTHIDGTMWRVVDCINVSHRAALMSKPDDLRDVIDR